MNLFEVLSFDERVIVLSVVEDQYIYTWNKSLTLQCWQRSNYLNKDDWEEINVRTLNDPPVNFEEARQFAISWDLK